MTHDDLVAAARLYGTLTAKSRDLARKELAGRLRTMGLRSTLEWLQGKGAADGPRLAASLMTELGIAGVDALDRLSAVEQLELDRRAHALCEAMHILARADHNQARDAGGAR